MRIWDVRRRALTPFRSDTPANSVAFGPDGRLLAAAGSDAGTEVRDVHTSKLVAHLRTGELARSVAFSPNGRLLFVGLFNGAGQFYSTHDWKPLGARVRGQGQRLMYPVFTPDGRTLATASADGTVLLWDVASRKAIGAPFTVQREAFVATAISHDGAYLYAAPTGTRGVRLALSHDAWKRLACTIAGRTLTRQESARGSSRQALPRRVRDSPLTLAIASRCRTPPPPRRDAQRCGTTAPARRQASEQLADVPLRTSSVPRRHRLMPASAAHRQPPRS